MQEQQQAHCHCMLPLLNRPHPTLSRPQEKVYSLNTLDQNMHHTATQLNSKQRGLHPPYQISLVLTSNRARIRAKDLKEGRIVIKLIHRCFHFVVHRMPLDVDIKVIFPVTGTCWSGLETCHRHAMLRERR